MKSIQLAYPATYRDRVENAIKNSHPIDWSREEEPDGERETVQVLLEDGDGQSLIDAIQILFASKDQWRLILMDVEATLPRVEKEADDASGNGKKKSSKQAMREALVQEVMSNSRLTVDFVVLTMLSAVVAAIGLNEDNVAVVIGAMVIAPAIGAASWFFSCFRSRLCVDDVAISAHRPHRSPLWFRHCLYSGAPIAGKS